MTIGAVGLSSLSLAGEKDSPAKIQKAATDFEAMMINQMLQSASESGGGIFGGGEDGDEDKSALVDLGQQQFAQALASSGGLGIAKMVVAGLTKHAD